MRRLMVQVTKAAASDVSVLVAGESGTGKELIARAFRARARPAVRQAVRHRRLRMDPPTLIGRRVLGHEKGAFTGADRTHVGAFEAAHGGTLFLDEIGELQPAIQAALLGALERRRIRRVGSRGEIAIDVRVISATHRDLRAEINTGSFRLDLFYRLAVVTLTAPALRDHAEDIPLLVEHFLRDAGFDGPIASLISPPAMAALQKLPLRRQRPRAPAT